MSYSANPVILCFRPRPAARLRLLCFAYAGGSAAVFRDWAMELEDVEVHAVAYPGRAHRLHSSMPEHLDELVREVAAAAGGLTQQGAWSVYGHSFGALLGFEVIRALCALGAAAPRRLIAAARAAPHIALPGARAHQLSDGELLELLERHFTADPLLRNRELVQTLLPTLRADLRLSETTVLPLAAKIDVPITAWGGTRDATVGEADLEAWAVHTTQEFNIEMIEGGHLFLRETPAVTLRKVATRVLADLDEVRR